MTWRKNGLVFALLLGLLVALGLRYRPFSADESGYHVELDLVSTARSESSFRYDTGEGWNYRQRQTVWVRQSAQPRTYRIALPSGVFNAFSIAPEEGVEEVLAGARIFAPDGTPVARIPAVQPAPGSNKVIIRLSKPLDLIAPDAKSWAGSVVDFVVCAGLVFLLTTLLERRGGIAWPERSRKAVVAFLAWTEARPRWTLLGVAVLAVAVSCHPVVFFGKSFVSPNNGVLCLYDYHPTLPGAPATPVEDWTSSDINATMWAHLQFSTITHDSVFRDHELPLWDRYGMCGLTLIGQAMSMIGDPLYWMTVVADGAAGAWDLRFLLSKLLFAFGLGLVVWRCTRHLGVAALLAFSCAFIGFFSYRFNHPAFFSVGYAPWILLGWLTIAEARTLRAAGWGSLALLAANWLEFNSGTAKEATMLMLGLNGLGALTVLFQPEPWKVRLQRLGLAALSCLAFAAIASPLLITFFDALKNGFTIYDNPRSNQLTPGLLIGLFDDLFYRQLMDRELHVDPALNSLVLLGVCWALVNLSSWLRQPVGKAAAIVAGLSLALVFAIVPPSLIGRLPLIRNIIHIDNTFTCVAIVPLFIVAGFGLRSALQMLDTPEKWRSAQQRTLFIVGGLLALYFGTTQAEPALAEFALQQTRKPIFSPFFLGYAIALCAALVSLPWLAYGLRRKRGAVAAQVLALALCLGILHFRHSQWLQTKFDLYVVNPQQRVDLQAPSPAVQYVRAHQGEPGRVIGLGQILRPGFNILYRLESTTGVDAISSQILVQWFDASGLTAISLWWPTVTKENAAEHQRVYDALNVRYYLASADDAAKPAPSLEKVASADLDVYESKSAWPRAFFTDRLGQYRDTRTLLQWVKEGDGRPFAAALPGEPSLPSLSPDQASRQIVPARDYRLTSNTTSFTIEAPAAGLVVLNESYLPKNFRAYLNGQRVACLRVNDIAKGVALPGPGTFQVKFVYWPYALTATLWIALGGLITVLMAAAALLFSPALRAAEFQTPLPPATARDPGA